jgi:arylsulfatase A-like enzyme
MAASKSVILITVDCLRADHCGFMGYPRPTTPFLDELARDNLVFPTAIVAGVPTYYSLTALLASRYPMSLGREVIGLAPEETNLASVFRQEGYATAFFGAGNPYLSARFGYDFGFDTFRNFLDGEAAALSPNPSSPASSGWAGGVNRVLERISHDIPGIDAIYDELYFQYCQRWQAPAAGSLDTLRRFPAADVIVDHACSWLASVIGNPFFLWLHFMDPHSPYYPTEKASGMLGQRLTPSRARYVNAYWNRSDLGSKRLRSYRDEVIALYDSGIRWVDAQIGRLLEQLRGLKLWESCILAFTADHGEEFLEHDRRYHAPGLAEELIHVPLVLRIPGVRKKALPSHPISLLHLAPTLLAAAELTVPQEFRGESSWKHIQEGTAWSDPAISECIAGRTNPFLPEQRRNARLLSIREERYKLVMNFESGADFLFDLQSDPREQSPLPGAIGKPARGRLLEVARAHLQNCAARQISTAYLRARVREIGPNLTSAAGADGRAARWANAG